MESMNEIRIGTPEGEKSVSVHCCDICDWGEHLDVMTISSFHRDYHPLRATLLGALDTKGVSVEALAQHPLIDLRDLCNIWLSDEIPSSDLPIDRIGCIEMTPADGTILSQGVRIERAILNSMQAYFRMLDIATLSDVHIESLGLPILGGGNQHVSMDLVTIPILNECLSFLKRNATIRDIHVITRNQTQAYRFARALDSSYTVAQSEKAAKSQTTVPSDTPLAFISYSSKDKNIADNLCSKLESQGIKAWYAPRDIVTSDYASSIVDAIARCSIFIVILSEHSLASEHVLNEIDLAFQELGRKIRFYPLKVDQETLGPAFKYYLSRQHWMDAQVPPLEKRLDEFVAKICAETRPE